jgi:predicted ATPase
MFSNISFARLAASPAFGYAAELPFFAERKSLAFKPGLNILFGPNGCGKSTVLRMMARTMCATQGGLSMVSEQAISENVDMLGSLSNGRRGGRTAMKHQVNLKVTHDGQAVVYCDPRATIGFTAGGAAFDTDFFGEGVRESLTSGKRSTGQSALSRMGIALAVIGGTAQFPSEVMQKVERRSINSTWCEALDVLEVAMVGTIPKGQGTILLDEPESNFSLAWQARLWELIAKPSVAERYQVIVASHSAFALGIAHANYIDFEGAERASAEAALRARFAK